MTGITVCLGGKAAATQRASSIKGLVKYGMTRASVTCELLNSQHGFRYEVYGGKISVERSFDTKGTSQYIIRDEHGKIRSRSRDELVEMMDTFMLVVDNPMTLLSQDTARSFLTNATPEDKYQLFMKGIRLDDLKRDYDNTHVVLDNTKRFLMSKAKDLEALNIKRREAAELFNRTQSHRRFTEKLDHLQFQYAWANVAEKLEIAEEIQEETHRKKQELTMALRGVEEATVENEEAKEAIKGASDDCDQASASLEAAELRVRQLREKMQSQKSDTHQIAVGNRLFFLTVKRD